MEPYMAFLQAADHLRTHPSSYNFLSTRVPVYSERETASACAYGWVCHFMDEGFHEYYRGSRSTKKLEPYDHFAFRMHLLNQKWYERTWSFSRKAAARCLMRYAEKYYAPDKAPAKAHQPLVSFGGLFRRVA